MGRVSLIPEERTVAEEQSDPNAHTDPSVPPMFAVRFSSERWKPLYMDGSHPNINYETPNSNDYAIGTEGHGAAEFFHGLSPSKDCFIEFWARVEPSIVRLRKQYHPGYHAFQEETSVISLGSMDPSASSLRVTYQVSSSTWRLYVGTRLVLEGSEGVDDTDDGWMRIQCRVRCARSSTTTGTAELRINGHQAAHGIVQSSSVLGDDADNAPGTSVSLAGHFELESPSLMGEELESVHAPFPGSIGKVSLASTPASSSSSSSSSESTQKTEQVSWQFQGDIASEVPDSSVGLKDPPPWTILMERERYIHKGNAHKLRTSEVSPTLQSQKPYQLLHSTICDNRTNGKGCSNNAVAGDATDAGKAIKADLRQRNTSSKNDKSDNSNGGSGGEPDLKTSSTCTDDKDAVLKSSSPCDKYNDEHLFDPSEYDDDHDRPETAEEERHAVLSMARPIPAHKIQNRKHAADMTDKPKLRTRVLSDGSCLNESAKYFVHSEQEGKIHGTNALTTDISKESESRLKQQRDLDTQKYYTLGREQVHEVHTLHVYKGTPGTRPWTLTTHTERVSRHEPTGALQLLGGHRSLSMVRAWMASRFALLGGHRPRDLLNVYADDKTHDDYTRRLLRRAVHDQSFRKSHPRLHQRIQQLVEHEDKHPPSDPAGDPKLRVDYEDHIYPTDPRLDRSHTKDSQSTSHKRGFMILLVTFMVVILLCVAFYVAQNRFMTARSDDANQTQQDQKQGRKMT